MLSRRNPSLVSSMHCPLLHRPLPTAVPNPSHRRRLLCQAHQIVTHQGFAFAVLFESMPCPLLNQSVPSTRATLPSAPSQCLHFTSPCSSSRRPGRAGLCRSAPLPQPRRTLQFFSLPRPCASSPSRSGLYRHGALQPTAVLFTRNSYPRNSMPPQFQPYQCSAVAPADHCVTVRAPFSMQI